MSVWVVGGLGLVLPNCGKIPRTFSPNATHNTDGEEKSMEAGGDISWGEKKKEV